MKLLINASINFSDGGLQVALSLIHECRYFSEHTYVILVGNKVASNLKKEDYSSNFIFYEIPSLKFYQYQTVLSKLELDIKPDVVFSVFGPVYWRPKSLHIMGFAMGYYIYNDSPFWKKISLLNRIKWLIKQKIHSYYFKKDADAFVVETEDVASRVLKCYNKSCFVISNTYNDYFVSFLNEKRIHSRLLPLNSGQEYRLLSICSSLAHKNLAIIPSVVDVLLEKGFSIIRFILTISEQDYIELIPPKYREYVLTIGVVPPENVPQLYYECHATFVPSLLECFTANFPESMIMNKPILASDLSYAHSICEDAALYFDPLDPVDIANRIVELYGSSFLQEKLKESGRKRVLQFKTAKKRTESYLKICVNMSNNISCV